MLRTVSLYLEYLFLFSLIALSKFSQYDRSESCFFGNIYFAKHLISKTWSWLFFTIVKVSEVRLAHFFMNNKVLCQTTKTKNGCWQFLEWKEPQTEVSKLSDVSFFVCIFLTMPPGGCDRQLVLHTCCILANTESRNHIFNMHPSDKWS